MTRYRLTATLGTLSVVALSATACISSEEPAATPTSTAPVQISFHPCDDLPRDFIVNELGFSEKQWTRTDREAPVVSFECSTAHVMPRYGSTFAARGMSFQSVLDDDRLTPIRRGTVDGRDAYYAEFAQGCFGTLDYNQAVFQMTVGYNPSSLFPDEEPINVAAACEEAERILTAISPYLPEQL